MAAKERWASRLGLVLAMAGNAVGLGNFLRFPAKAAQNGGGAFLIPYFVAFLVVGLPLIWIEWTMGRWGGKHGHHSAPGVLQSMGRSGIWKYLGVFGLWVNLVIASFYLYIETWTLSYAGFSLWGGFRKTSGPDFFASLVGDQSQIVAYSGWGLTLFFLCMGLNVFILSRGLAKGIEIVCKIGMPLLIVFGAILAIRGLLIVPGAGPNAIDSAWADRAAIESPFTGLNFVWNPQYDQLANPAVWLAAAGQIFFTLSIGMGSIHCYASYLREKDDVALTGATAAWTNEFCEVVLGGTILIPIAVAYLGLPRVQEMTQGGSGFGLGFMVFPTLFQNWGGLAPMAGFLWFGLLFFAAITSSLAMGQPIMAFLQSEFGMSRAKSAWTFGAMLLPLAIPVACLNQSTFFDEFDNWAGTFALVVFALIESILFAWVFGMERGWAELNHGAELRVPRAFYFVMKYVTPVFLLVILLATIFKPAAGWEAYVGGPKKPAWAWADDSVIGLLLHKKLDAEQQELSKRLESPTLSLPDEAAAPPANLPPAAAQVVADDLAKRRADMEARAALIPQLRFWRDIDRLVMIGTFAFFSILVAVAWRRRRAEGRST